MMNYILTWERNGRFAQQQIESRLVRRRFPNAKLRNKNLCFYIFHLCHAAATCWALLNPFLEHECTYLYRRDAEFASHAFDDGFSLRVLHVSRRGRSCIILRFCIEICSIRHVWPIIMAKGDVVLLRKPAMTFKRLAVNGMWSMWRRFLGSLIAAWKYNKQVRAGHDFLHFSLLRFSSLDIIIHVSADCPGQSVLQVLQINFWPLIICFD